MAGCDDWSRDFRTSEKSPSQRRRPDNNVLDASHRRANDDDLITALTQTQKQRSASRIGRNIADDLATGSGGPGNRADFPAEVTGRLNQTAAERRHSAAASGPAERCGETRATAAVSARPCGRRGKVPRAQKDTQMKTHTRAAVQKADVHQPEDIRHFPIPD
ncbi:hypothetical protein EYF80_030834 [Liparis tanakae]|uniref:Uncharacterized protein n=1 Tax=Liparis tanakae TaxID=230148 RepID=A0A4Z2H007_9TELE|nr:hypothetical protein EYF80_030834 [Liparis tanakae]